MLAEIQLPPAIPFEDGFFCIPDQGEEFLEDPAPKAPLFEKKGIVLVKEMNLFLIQEFVRQPLDPRSDQFDIHAYPAIRADDGSGIVPTVGDGEMEPLAGKEGFTG